MLLNRTLINLIVLVIFWLSLPVQADHRVIAFAQDTMANDFRQAQVYEVRDTLEKYPDMEFVYSDAKGQTSLLIWQIERFIKQAVDLLIVGTNDEDAVVPIVTEAYESGIPVIILDRGISGERYTTFINSDNQLIGKIAAGYIAKSLKGAGEVLLFEGLQKADVTQLRTKGFLEEIAQHPQIAVTRRTGNYLRKDAILEMEKLLKSGRTFDAIFAESDSMLSGVRLAMNKYGVDPATVISVGCDYITEAREAIRDGTQSASILFPLGGREAAEVAMDILAGKEVPRHIEIPVRLITPDDIDNITPVF